MIILWCNSASNWYLQFDDLDWQAGKYQSGIFDSLYNHMSIYNYCTVNDSPHPHVPVIFGLLKTNSDESFDSK